MGAAHVGARTRTDPKRFGGYRSRWTAHYSRRVPVAAYPLVAPFVRGGFGRHLLLALGTGLVAALPVVVVGIRGRFLDGKRAQLSRALRREEFEVAATHVALDDHWLRGSWRIELTDIDGRAHVLWLPRWGRIRVEGSPLRFSNPTSSRFRLTPIGFAQECLRRGIRVRFTGPADVAVAWGALARATMRGGAR